MYQNFPKPIKRVGRPRLSERKGQLSTREKIFSVATQFFLKKGYASVSISEVTELVQVTKPTLYHHFGDKESLYIQVLNRMIALGENYLQKKIRENLPLEDFMKQVATDFIAMRSDCCMGFLFKDVVSNLEAEEVEKLRCSFESRIIQPLAQAVSKEMACGKLKKSDPTGFAWLMVSVLDGLLLQHHILGRYSEEQLMVLFSDALSAISAP